MRPIPLALVAIALCAAACTPLQEDSDTGSDCQSLSGVAGMGDLTAVGFTGIEVMANVGAQARARLGWTNWADSRVTTSAYATGSDVSFTSETCEDGTSSNELVFDVAVWVGSDDGRLDEAMEGSAIATAGDRLEFELAIDASSLGGSLEEEAAACEVCDDPWLQLDVVLGEGWSSGMATLVADYTEVDDGVVVVTEGIWDGGP